jgi:hypothetical protein
MAGGLERRVKDLETGGGRRCPECGLGVPRDWGKAAFEVVWEPDRDVADTPRESVYCETCGELVHTVVTWGDGA